MISDLVDQSINEDWAGGGGLGKVAASSVNFTREDALDGDSQSFSKYFKRERRSEDDDEEDEGGDRRIDIRDIARHIFTKKEVSHKNWVLRKKLIDFFLAFTMLILTLIEIQLVTFRLSYLFTPDADSAFKIIECTLDVIELAYLIIHLFSPPIVHGIYVKPTIEHTVQSYIKTKHFWSDLAVSLPAGIFSWALGKPQAYWRVLKLVSILSFSHRFNVVLARLSIEFQLSPLIVRLWRQAATFYTVGHLFACGWYICLTHDIEDASGPSVQPLIIKSAYTVELGGFHNGKDILQLYLLGFDWAVKMMCGYGVVGGFPSSDRQVFLFLCVAMVGICLFASFLGTVTTLVSDLATNNARSRLRTKIDEVSDALDSMNMPQKFREEARRYYNQVFKMAGSVGHTGLLNDLPPTLLVRVNHEIAKSVVTRVPMFANVTDAACVNEIMLRLVPKIFLPEIDLVKTGDLGQEMFFVQSGELEVTDDSGTLLTVLQQGHFYGEAALLGPVVRTTNVKTLTSCMLFVFTTEEFEGCLVIHPTLKDHVQAFVEGTHLGKLMYEDREMSLRKSVRAASPVRTVSGTLSEPTTSNEDPVLPASPARVRIKDRESDPPRPPSSAYSVSELLQTGQSDLMATGSFLFGQSLQSKPMVLLKSNSFDSNGSKGSRQSQTSRSSTQSSLGGAEEGTAGHSEKPKSAMRMSDGVLKRAKVCRVTSAGSLRPSTSSQRAERPKAVPPEEEEEDDAELGRSFSATTITSFCKTDTAHKIQRIKNSSPRNSIEDLLE